jgi:hypothetical protein
MSHEADVICHFAASTIAAIINFPLWRASAITQSGFKLEGNNFMIRYYQAAVKPPFKGLSATIAGMSWARASIFYGSERGKIFLTQLGFYGPVAQVLPPLVIGTIVQCINMPLVRSTITIQNPKCELKTVSSALLHIYATRGIEGIYIYIHIYLYVYIHVNVYIYMYIYINIFICTSLYLCDEGY